MEEAHSTNTWLILMLVYTVIYSKLIDIELTPAPEKVRNLAMSLPKDRLELKPLNLLNPISKRM